MPNYNPNFSDPRTQKRVKNALGFVKGCFSETKSMSWSTRYIDKYLGSQNHNLSKWLRRHLLIETNTHYNKDTGQCKQYLLNRRGYEYVRDRLTGQTQLSYSEWNNNFLVRTKISLRELVECDNIEQENNYNVIYPSVAQVEVNDEKLVHDWITEKFHKDLSTKNFEYDDKSSRLWHPLQRVKRNYKKAALAEYDLLYQYDIECAAPTLLLQYSQHIPLVLDENNKWIQGPMDLWLFAINRYLKDKSQVRKELARNADITEQQAKIIINALFAGAVISQSPTTEIYQMLDGDRAKIEYLKQDEFLCELRSDIKTMWDYIKVTLPHKTNKSGRRIPISSKQKWILYFDLERKILDVVRKYLSETNNEYFLEHDGWTCVSEIDETDLIDYIRTNTGFNIKLSCEKLVKNNYNVIYPSVAQVEVNDI